MSQFLIPVLYQICGLNKIAKGQKISNHYFLGDQYLSLQYIENVLSFSNCPKSKAHHLWHPSASTVQPCTGVYATLHKTSCPVHYVT